MSVDPLLVAAYRGEIGGVALLRFDAAVVADFLTDDAAALAARKEQIGEAEWQHAEWLGRQYLRDRPGLQRDGRPLFASRAAKLPSTLN